MGGIPEAASPPAGEAASFLPGFSPGLHCHLPAAAAGLRTVHRAGGPLRPLCALPAAFANLVPRLPLPELPAIRGSLPLGGGCGRPAHAPAHPALSSLQELQPSRSLRPLQQSLGQGCLGLPSSRQIPSHHRLPIRLLIIYTTVPSQFLYLCIHSEAAGTGLPIIKNITF